MCTLRADFISAMALKRRRRKIFEQRRHRPWLVTKVNIVGEDEAEASGDELVGGVKAVYPRAL